MEAVASGATEKAVLTLERFRPEEKRHTPRVDMCSDQCRGGFQWLDTHAGSPYLTGERMTRADVTAVAAYEFVRVANPELFETLQCPTLDGPSRKLTALDTFRKKVPPV